MITAQDKDYRVIFEDYQRQKIITSNDKGSLVIRGLTK